MKNKKSVLGAYSCAKGSKIYSKTDEIREMLERVINKDVDEAEYEVESIPCKKLIKLLKSYKLDNKQIILFLHQNRSMFFGMSTLQFIGLDPENNEKIVLENVVESFTGEAMGS